MSKIRKSHTKREEIIKQIAQTTKQRLILLIAFLIVIILALVFRAGEALWFVWMIKYRTQIIGFFLFIVTLLTLLSPVIIEVNSNPRALSGPGKNPKGPNLP